MAKKDKITALLLAIFLGFFAWIYTYRDDAWKFWLNLVLTIFTIGIWYPISWIWVVVDMARRDEKYFKSYK